MMSIKKILDSIFARITVKNKWQIEFLIELFELLFSIQGRINYSNLARFSKYNEVTFRRNFKKIVNWLDFNLAIMELAGLEISDKMIAVMDCSFIPKAGKCTFGLDKFWSGVASRNKKGLEISLICLINIATGKAWSLDVKQTPANLSAKETEEEKSTRIDFYLLQIKNLLSKLSNVTYFVGDGYYAKTKVFNKLASYKKHLITKFRPDANLRYFYKGEHPRGKRGRRRVYGGKVIWKKIDLRKWKSVGRDYKYPHLQIYSLVLNSPHYKRDFRIVLLRNTRTNKYVLLACTDLKLDARLIVKYYQLRFKIEFIFRDAKQFTGLTHCQARDEASLNFHFNMSLAAINVLQLAMKNDSAINSMNSFVRKSYNTRFVKKLLSQLSSKAEFNINHPKLISILSFGCLQRA